MDGRMTATSRTGTDDGAVTLEATDDLAARRQDPRYVRLMAATRRAARKGYDNVSMRDLASTTKMSLATIYSFCPSKDQLIAEAHADRMAQFRARLDEHPPGGTTAEERVLAVAHGMVDTLEKDEVATRALMRALYSGGPGVGASRLSVTATYRAIVDAAIGDEELPDRAAVIETFGFVINSVILDWLTPGLTSEGHDATFAREALDQAVHVLFGGRRTR
jgi:AcrR family transcriptional regulator